MSANCRAEILSRNQMRMITQVIPQRSSDIHIGQTTQVEIWRGFFSCLVKDLIEDAFYVRIYLSAPGKALTNRWVAVWRDLHWSILRESKEPYCSQLSEVCWREQNAFKLMGILVALKARSFSEHSGHQSVRRMCKYQLSLDLR